MLSPRVYVDWDRDGDFTTAGDDLSDYVKAVSWDIGIQERRSNVARGGGCEVILNNLDRRFSPEYVSGPYYGKFRPGLPIMICANDGLNEWQVFYGLVTGYSADNGDRGSREARLQGEDFIGYLSRVNINLPVRSAITSDEAIKLITSAAFRSQRAEGVITINSVPSSGDTVTIGDITYTFTSGALDSTYKVKLGTSTTSTALNLAACINAAQTSTAQGYEYNTVYGNSGYTIRHPDVTAYAEVLDGAAGGTTTIAPVSGLGESYIGKMPGGIFRSEAQSFKVASGTLSQITVTLGAGTAGSPGDMEWSIREDLAGVPGAVLQSGTWTPTPGGVNTIAVSGGISLQAGVTYWLVLRLASVPADIAYYTVVYGNDNYADGINAIRNNTDPWIPISGFDDACSITTGSISGANVYISAVARGAWGNAIELDTTSAAISLSGSSLSGGVDGPDGLIACDTGTITFEEVGTIWDGKQSALAAISDVVSCEGNALFWCASDGTLTFRNRHWIALQQRQSATLTLNGEFQGGQTTMGLDDIVNRITVRYRPPSTRASGVVARSDQIIEVPGTTLRRTDSGAIERYNSTDNLPDPRNTAFVKLSFVDAETGRIQSAENLILPLAAGTDYSLNDFRDGTGFDYTNSGLVRFDVAAVADGVEITMQNAALGQLYVSGLQVRGDMKIAYDPLDFAIEAPNSIADYGLSQQDLELPLIFTGITQFVPQLAAYVLARYSEPNTYLDAINFQNIAEIDGVNLYSLDIGSVVEISEPQTAVNGWRMWITGISGNIAVGGFASLSWRLRRLDTLAMLILDDSTYGQLDNNRLAL